MGSLTSATMRITGILLATLAVLGSCSAKLFVADNLLSTLGRDVFEFDHFRPDFHELLQHPYMKNFHSEEDSLHHLLSNSFIKTRSRRSTVVDLNITADSDILAEDKNIILQNLKMMPAIDLEIKFKIPMFQVYESTFVNFNIPMNFGIPLYTTTHIAARDWNNQIQPALDDLEGIVSMLGIDGRSCVLRAVCETAESPAMRPEGTVGAMLEVFVNYLTMESPESNEIDGEEEILSRRRRDYTEASLKGREIGGCSEHYPTCPMSLFNIRTSELF